MPILTSIVPTTQMTVNGILKRSMSVKIIPEHADENTYGILYRSIRGSNHVSQSCPEGISTPDIADVHISPQRYVSAVFVINGSKSSPKNNGMTKIKPKNWREYVRHGKTHRADTYFSYKFWWNIG